jgi:hypothetical protein
VRVVLTRNHSHPFKHCAPTLRLLVRGTMTKDQLRRDAPEDDRPPTMPDELQPAMQSVLAILADIDFAHEREVEKVNNSGLDDVFKSSLIAKLDHVHQQRRKPYAQELVRLQHRFRSLRNHERV